MVGWVRKLLWSYYGRTFDSNKTESNVTVGVAAVLIAKANPARFELTIGNNGTSPIVFSTKPPASATDGTPIAAGQALGLTWAEDGDWVTSDIYAISSAAGQVVHIMEQVAVGPQESDELPGQ